MCVIPNITDETSGTNIQMEIDNLKLFPYTFNYI